MRRRSAGADTITCTDPTYPSITYLNSDGLTLTLDNSAMVIGPTVADGVSLRSSVMNTNDLVINANLDTLTATDGNGMYVENNGAAGNAMITLTNGRIVATGDNIQGLQENQRK